MKDHFDIASDIRLIRSADDKTIIMVEGPHADMNFYGNLFDDNKCRLIPCNGKKNALNALDILISENAVNGILCIVDSDFWKIDGIIPKYDILFLTDTHDIETMIIKSKSFKKLLREYLKNYKDVNELMNAIFLISQTIGSFKYINQPNHKAYCLSFKEINFDSFISMNNFEVDINKMIKEVVKNTKKNQKKWMKKKISKKQIEKYISKGYNIWQICSGHDMVKALLFCLINKYGNKKAFDLTAAIIESELRLVYTFEEFKETELFKLLKNWEDQQFNYKIF